MMSPKMTATVKRLERDEWEWVEATAERAIMHKDGSIRQVLANGAVVAGMPD